MLAVLEFVGQEIFIVAGVRLNRLWNSGWERRARRLVLNYYCVWNVKLDEFLLVCDRTSWEHGDR